jgi:hypothetical protein
MLLMRRIYRNAQDAHAALIKPQNQLSAAMWSTYARGGYEISDISITIDDTQFGSVEEYDDNNGNLVFDDFDLNAIAKAFEFNNFNNVTVLAFQPINFSRSEILTAAYEVMKDRLRIEDSEIIEEFKAYVASTEDAKVKTTREIVEYLDECGALDYQQ